MAITSCPICGAKIQASIKVYLTDVVLGSDGIIGGFELEHVPCPDSTPLNEAIRELVETAEGDELLIYCENDHPYNPLTERWGGK